VYSRFKAESMWAIVNWKAACRFASLVLSHSHMFKDVKCSAAKLGAKYKAVSSLLSFLCFHKFTSRTLCLKGSSLASDSLSLSSKCDGVKASRAKRFNWYE
jgi:hypothetical protein